MYATKTALCQQATLQKALYLKALSHGNKGNHSDISDIIEVALKNIGCKSSI